MRQTTSKSASAGPALLLLLALSACAEATDVDGVTSGGRCATCHLSSEADAASASGAHLRHLTAGALGGPFACSDCHAVPAAVAAAAGHRDGQVDLAFSARAGGATAQWNAAQQTCAVACHGTAAPVWTRTDGTQAQCGSCHGLPPGAGHPPSDAGGCRACHPATVRSDGTIDAAGGTHVDGDADVLPNVCGTCHGIPPRTGLHLVHVEAGQLSCAVCHAGATATDPGAAHLNGAVEMSIQGWPTTRTCANVCHGPGSW